MTTPTPPDPADRFKEFEAEDANRPLTPEELDMLYGPRGQPLHEIIAEFERRLSS